MQEQPVFEWLSSPAGRTARTVRVLVLLGAWIASTACGGSVRAVSSPSGNGEATERDTTIVHEDCDIDSAPAQDIDRDGRPDLAIVSASGDEECRAVDLNFDGSWDVWTYNDSNGRLRRSESDFDRDGRVDEIAIYRAGVLTSKQRATTLGGKLDTWQYYENGKLTRTERDSDGNAFIDQWWEYPRGARADCPLIHSDVDGDGRPDPGATVDLCPADTASNPSPPKADEKADAFEEEEPPQLTETVEEAPAAASKPPAEKADKP